MPRHLGEKISNPEIAHYPRRAYRLRFDRGATMEPGKVYELQPMKTLLAIVLLLASAAVGQETQSLNELRGRAEKGDAGAQFSLGVMCYYSVSIKHILLDLFMLRSFHRSEEHTSE